MKDIKLKKLALENFMGFRSLEANFGDGVTTVRGDNGTGKTTLMDAFLWCLFGKDHNGRTDFEIKTKAGGTVIPRLDHGVAATLAVNGAPATFRRVLVEKWVRPRGKKEQEFQGNETKYYYNNVEIKASAYSARVSEAVDEQLFRLLTSPSYFASLDWQKRRDILVRIAGDVTLEEAAAGREDMRKIIDALSGKALSEYRQELAYRRKKIKEELDECPVKVRAIESVMPEEPDYAALDARAAELESEIKAVDGKIEAAAETAKAAYEAQKAAYDRINALKMRQNELVTDERNRRRLEYMEKNADAELAKSALANTEREYEAYKSETDAITRDTEGAIAKLRAEAKRHAEEREELVKKWQARNAEEYRPSAAGLTCPVTGMPCTDATALSRQEQAEQAAREAFDRKKDADLESINARGRELNAKMESALKAAAEMEENNAKANEERTLKAAAYEHKIQELQEKARSCKVVEIDTDVKGEDIEEWRRLRDEIESTEIDNAGEANAKEAVGELQEKRRAIEAELAEVKAGLSVRDAVARNRRKIDEIMARERELAQQQADIEGTEYVAEQLNKARMDKVEERVNAMFRQVRFALFATQINGGIADACDILVGENGVKYGSGANHAAEVNAGLDIINTLSAYHGVTAPIFIDNAEGVTELLPVQAQVIRLVVDERKKQLDIEM